MNINVDAAKLSKLLEGLMGHGTRAQLARDMNVNAQTLRAYMRGDINNPTKDFLDEVAKYMGVDLDSLIQQIAPDSMAYRVRDGSVSYYINASDVIPKLVKMPLQDKLEVAKYLLNNAV